jgi:hypothetical protein
MPQPGDILCHKEFEFEDGTKKTKLLVVLNSADDKTSCLALKTTSQIKRYSGSRQGCNPDQKVFYAPAIWQKCFDADTYIQLPQIFEFSTHDLISGGLAKRFYIQKSITSECLARLKNCLKKFKEDISQHHWKMIFKS